MLRVTKRKQKGKREREDDKNENEVNNKEMKRKIRKEESRSRPHHMASRMAFSGMDLEKPRPLHISVGRRDSAPVGRFAIALVARNFFSS